MCTANRRVNDVAPSCDRYSTSCALSGNSFTFVGESLTVNNNNGINGGLLYKGSGTTGITRFKQLNINGGRRSSTAKEYLRPVMKRGNLRVETGVLASRIVVENVRDTDMELLDYALEQFSLKPVLGAHSARGCGELAGTFRFFDGDGKLLKTVVVGDYKPSRVMLFSPDE